MRNEELALGGSIKKKRGGFPWVSFYHDPNKGPTHFEKTQFGETTSDLHPKCSAAWLPRHPGVAGTTQASLRAGLRCFSNLWTPVGSSKGTNRKPTSLEIGPIPILRTPHIAPEAGRDPHLLNLLEQNTSQCSQHLEIKESPLNPRCQLSYCTSKHLAGGCD